jgi:hypothetical protein
MIVRSGTAWSGGLTGRPGNRVLYKGLACGRLPLTRPDFFCLQFAAALRNRSASRAIRVHKKHTMIVTIAERGQHGERVSASAIRNSLVLATTRRAQVFYRL